MTESQNTVLIVTMVLMVALVLLMTIVVLSKEGAETFLSLYIIFVLLATFLAAFNKDNGRY